MMPYPDPCGFANQGNSEETMTDSSTLIRLTKADREILERIAGGWRPMLLQIGSSGNRLERRGLLRVDWGPENTPDADKMVCYLTDRARSALER